MATVMAQPTNVAPTAPYPNAEPGEEWKEGLRKQIEESFGWMKTIGMLKKVKLRGLEKVD